MRENITDKKRSDTQVMENSSPVKILIVDDDGYFGKSLVELLHANGYFAHLADNTDNAREAIFNDHFDIIISDANMPGATCAELIIYSKKQLSRPINKPFFCATPKPQYIKYFFYIETGSGVAC